MWVTCPSTISVFMYHKIVYGMDMISSILLNSVIHCLYISISRVCASRPIRIFSAPLNL